MLEVVVDARRAFSLRQAVTELLETGEYETLHDDLRDCFTEDQIEEIEQILESGDIDEALEEIIEDWSGDDFDELIETIETYFAEASIEVRFVEATLELEDEFEDDAGVDDEEIDEAEELEDGDDA